MLAVRSLEASTERYIHNCIRAYLEGQQDLKWIVGVIGPATDQARTILPARFGQYVETERFKDLIARL